MSGPHAYEIPPHLVEELRRVGGNINRLDPLDPSNLQTLAQERQAEADHDRAHEQETK